MNDDSGWKTYGPFLLIFWIVIIIIMIATNYELPATSEEALLHNDL